MKFKNAAPSSMVDHRWGGSKGNCTFMNLYITGFSARPDLRIEGIGEFHLQPKVQRGSEHCWDSHYTWNFCVRVRIRVCKRPDRPG